MPINTMLSTEGMSRFAASLLPSHLFFRLVNFFSRLVNFIVPLKAPPNTSQAPPITTRHISSIPLLHGILAQYHSYTAY